MRFFVLYFTLIAVTAIQVAAPGAAEQAVRVTELESRTVELEKEGKFHEALELAKERLALLKSATDTKPNEVADAERWVSTLAHIASLSHSAQEELAETVRLRALVSAHYKSREYAQAIDVVRRQLNVERRHLGSDNSRVATRLNVLAALLRAKGELAEAEPLYREALAMRRKLLGEEHHDVAVTLHNLALLLATRGGYKEAEQFYREAAATLRKTVGDEHTDLPNCLSNLATVLYERGDYAEAESFCREALAMRRKLLGDEHPQVAASLNILAGLLHAQGDYAGAEPFYREALVMGRKLLGDEHPQVAVTLNNLAMLLQRQGDYVGAEPFYREALAMYRKLGGGEHPNLAKILNGLAALLHEKGDYAGAEPLYREALAMDRKLLGDEHPDVAVVLNNLAELLKAKGDHAGAEPLYREALAMQRRLLGNDHPDVAQSLNNLALLLKTQGDYAGAEPLYREALTTWQLAGHEHPRVVAGVLNLASLYLEQGDYARAEPLFRKAAGKYDVARIRAGSGVARAEFIPSPYPGLAATQLYLGNTVEAWDAVEKSLGRALADLLIATDGRSLTPLESAREDSLRVALGNLEQQLQSYRERARIDKAERVQNRAAEARDRLVMVEAEWSRFQREISQKYPVSEGEAFTLELVQSAITEEEAIIGWLDVAESWVYVIRKEGDVRWAHLKATREDPAITLRLLSDALVQGSSIGVARNARAVYAQRLEPIIKALDGVTHLIVLPNGMMLGIPVEVLVDGEGHLLLDRFVISYAPSATIYTWLIERSADRSGERGEQTLLVGDPPFSEHHLPTMERSDQEMARCPDVAYEVDTIRSILSRSKSALSGLDRLPCTRVEVEAIAEVVSDPMLLLGSEASEQALVDLAESDRLRQFQTLHFATHAFVDAVRFERSSLILSQVDLPDPLEAAMKGTRIYDGLVTAGELVREWKLDADLVTLSACQTGIGKVVEGEGYVGFTHAFLQAGARSLLVSLWKVDDRATSLLMRRFYENWKGRYDDVRGGYSSVSMTKAEALQEAKQYVRSYVDEHGDRLFEHPFFWSAFILLGAPD